MSHLMEKVCEAGRLMFARRLTDLLGGNISARDEEQVYMSPRFAGERWHWNLAVDDLVTGDWRSDEMANQPRFSREGWAHLYIYRAFPNVRAVVHAHPLHILPFAASGAPIQPVLEVAQHLGVVPVCRAAASETRDLAENIVAALCGREALMHSLAAPVIMPGHGIILAGEDLDRTLAVLELVDENAYCLLHRGRVQG